MRPKYELTDEDTELAEEVAYEARGLFDATVRVLTKIGWRQDFHSGDWQYSQRCEGEHGELLLRPIAITHFALQHMACELDSLLSQLRKYYCEREAAIIEWTWLKMPSFIKEGRHRTAAGMELEILRQLMTPRRNRP